MGKNSKKKKNSLKRD